MIRECENRLKTESINESEVENKKSPVELQREMRNLVNDCIERKNTQSQEIDNNEKIAAVAAIEGNLPYFCFFDDGKQVNVNANGFSKPALLGLLVTFVEKFKKELV